MPARNLHAPYFPCTQQVLLTDYAEAPLVRLVRAPAANAKKQNSGTYG